MKKVIALVLSLMLIVAFSIGCKPAETPKEEAPAVAPEPAPAPEQPAAEQAPAPEQPSATGAQEETPAH